MYVRARSNASNVACRLPGIKATPARAVRNYADMAPRVVLLSVLVVIAFASPCNAQVRICNLCWCTGSKVSCYHMGVNFIAVPPGIPSATVEL